MEFGIFDHVDRSDEPLADYYESRLKLVEAYDRHGFYCYHVAEHHSTPLGLASSPSVYLSAVAQRTRRLRFGPLVYLLPFYHPLRLIEEICFLDQASRGRMQIGIGRGISPFETRYYGIDPEEGRARFDEALAVLLKGLTQKTLSHDGAFYKFDNVPMETQPYQKPHPPLWMGVNSPASAAVAGARGVNIVSLVSATAMRPVADAYWQTAGQGGRTARKAGLSFFIVVSEDAGDAAGRAEDAYAAWYRSFNHLYRLHGRSPMLGERPATFAEAQKFGCAIAGTPAQVSEFLCEAIRQSGINYVVGQFMFGTMAPDFAGKSIDLFAQQVMPQVRRFAGDLMPAAAQA
jgi:alkanesulfonate monooxygenase SsuD/methylene tetrahydromethanopterin reductase-like flavin-dependent oxidoreductase (luciferase family)